MEHISSRLYMPARNMLPHISAPGTKYTRRDPTMLNFEEELEKFEPCNDVEKVEDVVYSNNMTDVTDIIKEIVQDAKNTL